MDKRLSINDKVISSSFGLGVIVDIERPEGMNRDFYIIESIEQNVRTMVPTEKTDTFRLLTSRASLDSYLKTLTKNIDAPIFDSKKDRIKFFKEQVSHQNIEEIFINVRKLIAITDRGSAETKILQNFLENILLEIITVFEIADIEAKAMINGCLDEKFAI